jgi:hypothetical protein
MMNMNWRNPSPVPAPKAVTVSVNPAEVCAPAKYLSPPEPKDPFRRTTSMVDEIPRLSSPVVFTTACDVPAKLPTLDGGVRV